MALVAGIDIGGGSTKFGVVDHLGGILSRHRAANSEVATPEELAEAYASGIDCLLEKLGSQAIAGIGIGFPGHLDDAGKMSTFSNVPLLDNFPIVGFLEQRFRLPVRVDNDATLAALAEHRFGSGGGAKRLLVATLGTGIGVGLVNDGQAQRPVRGCMGDPGHIIVDPEARSACRQGCHGCLESVASSLALERDAKIVATRGSGSRLAEFFSRDGCVGASDVIEAARDGDAAATALIEKLGTWLGMAAASWCYVYDPDLILFGGGVSAAGQMLLSSIDRTMRAVGMPAYVSKTKVGLAALGNNAGLIGAASLFMSPTGELNI